MPDACLVVSFIYIFFGTVCQTVRGDIFRAKLIHISGQRIYIKGQRLVLNCTTPTHKFDNNDLQWTKDGKPLLGKRINNDTLQVIKSNVELTDSGGYRCAIVQQKHLIRSVKIHVTVGVAPPQPTNISWRNINSRICVSWSPVSSTNGYSVTYKIRYRCVTDCDPFLYDDTNDEIDSSNVRWRVDCKNTRNRRAVKLHCCLDDVDLFVRYEAVVIATNLLGSSSSKTFHFIRNIQTIPEPPTSLKLQAEGYGEITLEWSTGDLMVWNTKFAILYNAEGERTNKTIITDDNGQKYYRITSLKPFTKYTVYVATIDHYSSNFGLPVGPVSIVTREEIPSDAPEITEWHSLIYPTDKRLRNVTIKWMLPSKENWNGMLTKFIIQYRQISNIDSTSENSLGRKMIINNSSATEGTIVAIRVDSAYETEMQMCNRAGCGGIGKGVFITAHVQRHDKHVSSTNNIGNQTTTVWISLAATVFALAAIVLFIIALKTKRKKRQTKTNPQCFSSIGNLKTENA